MWRILKGLRATFMVFWFSCVWPFMTLWTAACQVSLSFTICRSLLRLMSIELVMLSNHLILCYPLLFLQSFPSSGSFPVSQLFTSGGQYISISSSNEYSGFISFSIDWFYLLGVQGTLKSLLQHHNLKASILWQSVFFRVQLSHLYITTGKIIASTI